jgi:hypothetical protein
MSDYRRRVLLYAQQFRGVMRRSRKRKELARFCVKFLSVPDRLELAA